jgi:hypothetical protein
MQAEDDEVAADYVDSSPPPTITSNDDSLEVESNASSLDSIRRNADFVHI